MDIHKELLEIHNYIQIGYSQYSMYFYIAGISAIIGGFFKLAGIGAFVLTITFFYFMGKTHATMVKQHDLKRNIAQNEATQKEKQDQLAVSQQASGSVLEKGNNLC